MDLHDLEPRAQGPASRVGEVFDHLPDLDGREFVRRRVVRMERQRTRRDRNPTAVGDWDVAASFPGSPGARLPARMRQLNPRSSALLFQKGRDARKKFDML